MNTSRHTLDAMTYWQERAADAARLRDELASAGRVDLRARLSVELELGLVQTMLGGDPAVANRSLVMAMDCGAALALARLCAPRGGFHVELRWPAPDGGEDYIRLPATDNGFGWPDWLDAFSLALLADDVPALAVLGTAGCVDACALPFARVDRFWPLLCGGLAALYQRDPAAPGLLDDAAQLLDQVSVMELSRAAALIAPLVPLARAVAGDDAAAVARVAGAALSAHQRWFAAQPDGSRDPDGLFALPASALLAEAERRGLGPLPDSDYRLAPFQRPEPAAELLLLYPRLGIQNAVEADWLMQAEGFARHDRSTLTQAADGRLVARYRAFDAPGIPAAELEFELLDAARDAIFDGSHAPPALDVGELLRRAEVLAGEPRRGPGGEPVYDVAGAVEAMDLAIAYVDAMPRGFDPATLHSAVGERLWRAEPGRFRRERMIVYRDALARAEDGRAAGGEVRSAECGVRGVPSGGPKARSDTVSAGAEVRNTDEEVGTTAYGVRGAGAPAGGAERVPGDAGARERVLELVEALTPLVLSVLQSIASDGEGGAVRELLPRESDYGVAFTGEAAAAARDYYGEWWPRQLAEGVAPSVDADWRIEAHLAPAGLLGSDNVLSRPFPGGYRKIAPWLNPHRVWVCWHYRPPGRGAGVGMNGLVWLDDHWAWFPKPYRLVGRLARH